jgi:Ca2+-binding RTX toxin-like protein
VGGLGTDLASYALRAAALKLTLNGLTDDGAAGEGDRIGSDVENLTGGKGADLLVGNALANLLTGGPGKDILNGLAGNDIFQTLDKLVDVLDGGAGTDKAHRDSIDKVTLVEQKF